MAAPLRYLALAVWPWLAAGNEGIFQDYGCWPKGYLPECCSGRAGAEAACFGGGFTRERCCLADRCPMGGWHVAQMLFRNIARGAAQEKVALELLNLLESQELGPDCELGRWTKLLLRCINGLGSCAHAAGGNATWAAALDSYWPVFTLLSWLPRARRVAVPAAELDLVPLLEAFARHVTEMRAVEYQPPEAWEESRRLARLAETWWRKGGSGFGALAARAGLWDALHAVHHALLHGFCGQHQSLSTRHPEPYGYRMCLPKPDKTSVIASYVAEFGYWQDADMLVHLFRTSVGERFPCTIVDVGANMGSVSFLLAKTGLAAVSVEPEAANFAALSRGARQLAADGWPNVRTVRAAAGDRVGRVSMEYLWGDGASTKVDWDSAGEVETAPLDDLLRQAKPSLPVCGLKVDAEGSEFRVLTGARDVLARSDVVVIEFEPKLLRAQRVPSPGALLRLLEGFYLYYIFMETRRGVLPVQTMLRPIPSDDPCHAASWSAFNGSRWREEGAGNILATRRPYSEPAEGGLPWVRARVVPMQPRQ